jgi:hypothetical protein
MTNDKLKPDISAGLKALSKPEPKPNHTASLEAGLKALKTGIPKPTKFPTVLRYIFACKKCHNAFPIETGVAVWTAMSIEEAYKMLAAFAKTVEPRTIRCSCGHEDEYHQKDVAFYALE